MSDSNDLAPQGEERPETADAGEAQSGGNGRRESRPDLDARQESIRTQRKAAGPPLETGGTRRSSESSEDDDAPAVDPEDE